MNSPNMCLNWIVRRMKQCIKNQVIVNLEKRRSITV